MNTLWSIIAHLVSRPAVVDYLIKRAKRTPYIHITGPDGSVYMERYWLFNPYPANSSGNRPWWKFPISIRLHRIMREDDDRDLHDHPWNARTVILHGWYREVRLKQHQHETYEKVYPVELVPVTYRRLPGDTARLRFGEYHRILQVSPGGVWTLFITGRYRGTWGFLVSGVKVPWRRYLGIEEQA
jgi:hypothetical protein